MRRRRDLGRTEELWASHAVRDWNGRRLRGIGKWIERVVSDYIKQGDDPVVVEIWVRKPRKGGRQ